MKTSLMILLVLSLSSCTTVEPGHVGIVVHNMGTEKGVSDYAPTTGFFFYNPLSTSVFSYPTSVQTAKWTRDKSEGHPADESITFTNKDNMSINVDVSISYSLSGPKVPAFYVKFRSEDIDGWTHGFLRNVTRDAFMEVGGLYDVDHIMGDNAEFITKVRTKVQDALIQYGIGIDQFGLIGSPRPPQQVIDSINAKLQATQIAIQKENEVRQAQADAAKAIAAAEGQAKATIARATGDAEANRIKAASITENILKWESLAATREAIGKWNGTPSQFVSGGNGNPVNFLFQMPHNN